ncbi:hypothetical protein B5F40_06995 [Gordonibacter sp. An230]|nr:hypothetical protein B5F40_06995 [Gordonibacter sp. An230]
MGRVLRGFGSARLQGRVVPPSEAGQGHLGCARGGGGCFYGFVNCFFGIGPLDSGMLAQTPATGLFFGDSAEG